ncbi:hypothetical protein [Nocardia sp. NPDC019255]|uniref:hypothetical protein n=1 Tax=Nocardia sp. NPDC019255 TaxID=3154591 RepID=UPI0033FB2081
MATLDDAGIAAATVGALQPYAVTVVLEEYNPAWPVWYAEEEAAIRAALGDDRRGRLSTRARGCRICVAYPATGLAVSCAVWKAVRHGA